MLEAKHGCIQHRQVDAGAFKCEDASLEHLRRQNRRRGPRKNLRLREQSHSYFPPRRLLLISSGSILGKALSCTVNGNRSARLRSMNTAQRDWRPLFRPFHGAEEKAGPCRNPSPSRRSGVFRCPRVTCWGTGPVTGFTNLGIPQGHAIEAATAGGRVRPDQDHFAATENRDALRGTPGRRPAAHALARARPVGGALA
jgi:hypothetical protein